MKKLIIPTAALFLLAFMFFTGCSKSDNIVGTGNGTGTGTDNVSLSIKALNAPVNHASVITITEAKALISEIEAEDSENSSHGLETAPYEVRFDLNEHVGELFSSPLPIKQYTKIKFKIHKCEDTENPSDPEFKEGSGEGQRYSFIIKGTYNGAPFVFKSKSTVSLIINLTNPVNNQGSNHNLTMLVEKFKWFLENGNEIDPRDPSKETLIDDNLHNSFKSVFKDDDHNGVPDNG